VSGWPSRRRSSRTVRAARSSAALLGTVPPAAGADFRARLAGEAWRRGRLWAARLGLAGLGAGSGQATAAGSLAVARCSRMPDSSLTAMSRATAGQPAMMRPMVPWSAVAMLAARLAAVPMVRAAQGSHPDLRPARRSASTNRAGDAGQPGHSGRRGPADPLVGPLRSGRRPGHFAAFGARDLGRRTGSGSPSIRMEWFAW